MRHRLFSLPLLIATTAFAQNQTTPAKQFPIPNTSVHRTIPFNACPVGMAAQRSNTGQLLTWTVSLEDSPQAPKALAARTASAALHVQLNAHDHTTSLRQVELAVYYVAPGSRLLPIETTAPPADLKKTFDLAADGGASLQLTANLLIGPASNITRVHLLSITYADGTSWTAASDTICSIEPNRFLRVDTLTTH
jgi:hypothetical protein